VPINDVAPQVPASPDLPAPRRIELVRPDITRPIQFPKTIDVHFISGPDRAINMAGFDATDGRAGSASTPAAVPSMSREMANGPVAHDIELMSGYHRVALSIADTIGKTASCTFNLSVVPGALRYTWITEHAQDLRF